MPDSGDVAALDDILADQYNQLRDDSLNAILILPVRAGIPPAANGAALSLDGGGATNGAFYEAAFDEDTDEFLDFTFQIPEKIDVTQLASGGSMRVDIIWRTTATSEASAAWEFWTGQGGSGDSYDPTLTSRANGNVAGAASAGNMSVMTLTWSNPSFTSRDLVRFRISRDANGDNNTDDLAADAIVQLVVIEFRHP